MPTPPLSEELMQQAVEAVAQYGSVSAAAAALGLPRGTFASRYARAKTAETEFEVAPLPSPDVPVDDLIERLTADYTRKKEHAERSRLVPVTIRRDGPIGLLVFGDPHLGSPHTNWPALKRDVELTQKTEALYGTNIGDTGDNWSGKLAHLWTGMGVSHSQEKQLSEWFLKNVRWLLWLSGNHDAWSGSGDLLPWLSRQIGVLHSEWEQRIALQFPNGREVRIGCYHGAKGYSLFNPGHGVLRTAKLGPPDHLVCAGHTHVSWVQGPIGLDDTGEWGWGLQVGSYKDIADMFGKRARGEREQNLFPSAVVVIDPCATSPAGLIRIFPDTVEGADYLTHLRRRFKRAA